MMWGLCTAGSTSSTDPREALLYDTWALVFEVHYWRTVRVRVDGMNCNIRAKTVRWGWFSIRDVVLPKEAWDSGVRELPCVVKVHGFA